MAAKKRLLLIPGLLILSFAASYAVSRLFGTAPRPASAEQGAGAPTTRPQETALAAAPAIAQLDRLRPRERQLEELIAELRGKIEECRRKQRRLERREKQIRMAQDLLKKDAEDLEKLRLQLVRPLARLKEAKAELQQTRIAIATDEAVNLKRTAKIYEKMDPASSSKILTQMCANNQEADAAKILHYMTDRPAAKLLAEMADKALAAKLTERLKRMKE